MSMSTFPLNPPHKTTFHLHALLSETRTTQQYASLYIMISNKINFVASIIYSKILILLEILFLLLMNFYLLNFYLITEKYR